jgi:hypothetical protein
MTEPTPEPIPVFIQGILARSGTNFLNDLLALHPDCCAPALHEDYLLTHAEWLDRYVQETRGHWDPSWAHSEATTFAALGAGLMRLLQPAAPRPRLVTKTPTVHNLPLFTKLWPQAYLLILVRDGRAVVESGVRSFPDWTYEKAIQWWAWAAKSILAYDAERRGPGQRHLVVRYEDLYSQPEREVPRVLEFLGLDPQRYDLEQARQLPVRGSSTYRGQSREVHWDGVEKTADFAPLERWRNWPRARHARFNWVAGPFMRQLGYDLVTTQGERRYWAAWNKVLDRRWLWGHRLKALRGRMAARR